MGPRCVRRRYCRSLAAIAQDGFFNAVKLNPAQFDRKAAFC